MDFIISSTMFLYLLMMPVRRKLRHTQQPRRNASENFCDLCLPEHKKSEIDVSFLSILIALALQGGNSIPSALKHVGTAQAASNYCVLFRIGEALEEGQEWNMAWSVCAENEQYADLLQVEHHLRNSWKTGVSPVQGMLMGSEEMQRAEVSRLKEKTQQLMVKIVLPTGLCFLPAFVLIAIVPLIIGLL